MAFWDLLRPPAATAKSKAPPKPATAAELAVALEEAKAAAAEAIRAAAEVAERRQTFLIGGTDDQLDQVDRELAAANRLVDKCEAAVEALQTRLVEAQQREAQEAVDKLYSDGQATLARGLQLYADYAEAAREVARIIGQIQTTAAEVDRARWLLRERGDPRTLPELDVAARPEKSAIPLLREVLWEQVRLPAADHVRNLVWPAVQHVDIPQRPIRTPGESAEPPAVPLPAGTTRW